MFFVLQSWMLNIYLCITDQTTLVNSLYIQVSQSQVLLPSPSFPK